MSKQADKLFFWIIMAVIFLAIASLSYFTFSSKTPTPPITATQTKPDPPALPKKKIQKPKQAVKTKQEKKKSSSQNTSSVKKKKDQEKIPPKNNPPLSILDTPPEEPVGSIDTLLEGLFQRVNSRAQMQYGQILIDDFNLLDGGMHIELRATTLWSLLPQPYKLQVLQVLANQYTLIACNVTRIINCSPDNIPSISILDSTGREVASHSSSRGPQIFE